MINTIIHISDIHIRNVRRQEEYVEQMNKLFDKIKDIVKDCEEDSVRIVVCGDIFQQKLEISGEAFNLAHWFFLHLSDIAKTIVITGNHDLNMANLSRIDPLTTLFNVSNLNNVYYLDKDNEYESGCIVDDNIVWCLFSSFDGFARPNIEEEKLNHPDSKFIGLFHGEIKGAKTDTGYQSEKGLNSSHFEGLDCCLCGHIHKRQLLNAFDTKIYYSGSLIQQDHGENIHGHGFGILDVKTGTYESFDIDNPNNGYYTFSINSEDDIDNDEEKLLNL